MAKKPAPRHSDISPALRRRLWQGFAALLLALLVAELFTRLHPRFDAETTPFFHAMLGFASCGIILLMARLLGKCLKRPEGYEHD